MKKVMNISQKKAIGVLVDYVNQLLSDGSKPETELNHLSEHVYQSLMFIALYELTHNYKPVKSSNGGLYIQQPTHIQITVDCLLDYDGDDASKDYYPTVVNWQKILHIIARNIEDLIGSNALYDLTIQAVIRQIGQMDIPEGRVFETFAEALNGSLIIMPRWDRAYAIALTQDGDWKDIPLHWLDDDLFLIKPGLGEDQLPLLKNEQDIQQIRHHFVHGDADDFSSLFNFNIVMCDKRIFWQDIECLNGELLTLMLAYRMMPDMKCFPMIYFASEFEEDPMPLLIKLRTRQIELFLPDGQKITPETMHEPTQSLINALIPMPVYSYEQEGALQCLDYVEDNKHELMAKLLQLVQRVRAIKLAMGDHVYDALLTDETLRKSYFADFYRFVMLATPIAFKTRDRVTADKLIKHIVTTQQYLIDYYVPYDELGNAIWERMQNETGLIMTDDYMIWSDSPQNILDELNTIVPESDRPHWWPTTAQGMEQLHMKAGSFLGRNFGIHASEEKNTEDNSIILLEYDYRR